MEGALKPEIFRKLYSDFAEQNPAWNNIPGSTGETYSWTNEHLHPGAALLRELFDGAGHITGIVGARPLGIFGDSVTTTHLAAGSFKKNSPPARICSNRACRRRVQQLRRAPRQRPGDDTRHVRQCPDQESHGAGVEAA